MTTWLQHVKKVHAAGSTSFKESLRRASVSWKKQKAGKKKGAVKASTAEPEAAPAPAPKKKKRRKRVKKSMPKIPAAVFSNVDSRNL